MMLAVTVFLTRQRVTMHIRNQHVGINCEFSLKGGVVIAIAEGN